MSDPQATMDRGAREAAIGDFLARHGWDTAQRRMLAGDASFRKYYRLDRTGTRAVLMDAPPPHEDVRPFVAVARHLLGLGFSAPAVLAADEAAGLLLLEDFGDDTYTHALAAGADEGALYARAVDLLIALHRHPRAADIAVPPYDDARLLAEAALFADWFLPDVADRPTPPSLRAEYLDLWRAVLPRARAVPASLVLRDYHVDNLMRIARRESVAACGLLDFQDAVIGPVAYDLVSLLEDARRDVLPDVASAMRARYLAAFPTLDHEAFAASCAILAAQRNAKIIGIFTRLFRRDGKPQYLAHIPRVWRLLDSDLRHPALADIRAWFARAIPPSRRTAPVAGAGV